VKKLPEKKFTTIKTVNIMAISSLNSRRLGIFDVALIFNTGRVPGTNEDVNKMAASSRVCGLDDVFIFESKFVHKTCLLLKKNSLENYRLICVSLIATSQAHNLSGMI
jgi:hypothetical protein